VEFQQSLCVSLTYTQSIGLRERGREDGRDALRLMEGEGDGERKRKIERQERRMRR
jgi:hypothetical protein